VAGGDEAVLAKTPWGKIGLTICYDVRFPQLYRALAQRDAFLLTVPSAFTETTGKAHWDTLLRARAIENVSYVVGVNRIGLDGQGVEYNGHSSVISPKGDAIFSNEGDEIARTIELNANSLHSFRDRFPAFMDADDFSIEFEAFEESDHLAG
jgi:predicted amidohydrolase